MARFAVIDPVTNLVVNAIEAGPGFTLDGFTLVASDTAGIGDAYRPATGNFAPPPISLDARKGALARAVETRRDAAFAEGFTPSEGPVAGHRLQTRDSDDKVNWLTSQAAYSAAVASGAGTVLGATFRTSDNATVVVSFEEGLSVLLAMAAWGSAIFGRSWALKDAIAAATDPADLDSIDIAEGWPT